MGDWFKTIVSSKKVKDDGSKKVKRTSASTKSTGFRLRKKGARKMLLAFANGIGVPVEDVAATRIQTAFRAYKARKILRRLKGTVRLQALTLNNSVKNQSTSTLSHIHSWCTIQAVIRARRVCMVTEGRRKQKKLENQLKLEAKLHDLEVEWNSGVKTMDEILSRIHQREEAAIKRERAMAYAFSHQWRADCNHNHGPGDKELSKDNWGWSWKDRWIAARPWESRVPPPPVTQNKEKSKQPSKVSKNTISSTPKASIPAKPELSSGKAMTKPRRLSYPAAVKLATPKKPEDVSTNKNQPRRVSYPPAEKLAAGLGSVKLEVNPQQVPEKKVPAKPAVGNGSVKSEVNTKQIPEKVQEKPAAGNGSVKSEGNTTQVPERKLAEKAAVGNGSVKLEVNTKKTLEKPAARKGSVKSKVNSKKELEKPAAGKGSPVSEVNTKKVPENLDGFSKPEKVSVKKENKEPTVQNRSIEVQEASSKTEQAAS